MNFEYLCDLSKKEKSWDKHKANAEKIANYYRSSEFDKYAQRIDLCAQLLSFEIVSGEQQPQLKLSKARFCKVRTCPICQWRKSLRWKAKTYSILPSIVKEYPTYRWLFLTLTVKNCQINELRDTLFWLNKSWQRLSQRKKFPAIGWIRTTEVTLGKRKTAHPHFHCLLLVKPSYFGKNYIKQNEWVNMWRSCTQIDYIPLVDIRPVKREHQPMMLIPEILKYSIKESDLIKNREWFLELTKQMSNMRTVATGGVIKKYFKQLKQTKRNIADTEKTNNCESSLIYNWRDTNRRYKLVN